ACAGGGQCHDAGTWNPATGACSSPARADGTSCDDADACTVADHCTAGACGGGPACGDGVVEAACGETCDDGAGNGTDHCCSAACARVDADGDGLCDAVDPCTGGVPIAPTLPKIGPQTTPPRDASTRGTGEMTGP